METNLDVLTAINERVAEMSNQTTEDNFDYNIDALKSIYNLLLEMDPSGRR